TKDGGDGLANVGLINATGLALVDVKVEGDLRRIETAGLKSLTVHSLGQGPAAPGRIASHLPGHLGTLRVDADVVQASVFVTGTIDLVRVDGSLLGGPADGSGVISSTGRIGRVVIGDDVRGGDGFGSGVIHSDTRISEIVVDGSLIG